MVRHLLVGEVGGMGHQRGRDVLPRPGPLVDDELLEAFQHVGVARERRLGGLEEVTGGVHELGAGLVRHAQQMGEREHGQVLGELAHQLHLAALAERVDQLVGEAGDVATDSAVVELAESGGDGSAQPLVLLAVRAHAVGTPADHRHERRGGGVDLPAPPAVPDAGVAGELGRAARHVPVLEVPQDEPGAYVAVEENGRHRSVGGAQLLVQAHGVRLGGGAVEPGRPAGSRADVGRAARGRGRAGVRGGVFSGWNGHAVSWAAARVHR